MHTVHAYYAYAVRAYLPTPPYVRHDIPPHCVHARRGIAIYERMIAPNQARGTSTSVSEKPQCQNMLRQYAS